MQRDASSEGTTSPAEGEVEDETDSMKARTCCDERSEERSEERSDEWKVVSYASRRCVTFAVAWPHLLLGGGEGLGAEGTLKGHSIKTQEEHLKRGRGGGGGELRWEARICGIVQTYLLKLGVGFGQFRATPSDWHGV